MFFTPLHTWHRIWHRLYRVFPSISGSVRHSPSEICLWETSSCRIRRCSSLLSIWTAPLPLTALELARQCGHHASIHSISALTPSQLWLFPFASASLPRAMPWPLLQTPDQPLFPRCSHRGRLSLPPCLRVQLRGVPPCGRRSFRGPSSAHASF